MANPETSARGLAPLSPAVRAELGAIYAQKLAAVRALAPVVPHGTVYYISSLHGSDDFDGTSPKTPWKTTANCAARIREGDTLLFECGSVFRRNGADYFIPELKNGMTLATYGEGAKPVFYGSVNVPASEWSRLGNSDVYCYDGAALNLNIYGDIGAIVFNGGEAWGVKTLQTFNDPATKQEPSGMTLALKQVDNGLTVCDYPSYPFRSGADLQGDLSFYHDYAEKKVYLCCKGGNPGKRFASVELSLARFPFTMENPAQDLTFQNLDFRNFGSHVIRPMNCKNIAVQNCEFRFIGGVVMPQYGEWRNYYTRLGNAVENWNACDGLLVENCYFDQIYDTVATTQTNSKVVSRNIVCKNNVAERFWWGVELWAAPGAELSGVEVSGNYFRNIGEGFTTQRPDKIDPGTGFSVNAFMTIGNGPYEMKHSVAATNNIADGTNGKFLFCNFPKTRENDDGAVFDRNTYVAAPGADLARLFGKFDKDGGVTYPYTAEGIAALQALGIEQNGKFYCEK